MTTLLSTTLSFISTIFTHLWLSVSSVNFYAKIFNSYKGYGVKYIFNISLISSLICTILFLNHINEISEYLNKDKISNSTENIDQIIRQIPVINYDGIKISTPEKTPLFLKNLENKKLLAIDPNNSLAPADRIKIPIILNSQKIIINFINSDNANNNIIPINYTQIFGTEPQILTEEVIKSKLSVILNKVPSLFIYLMFPIIGVLIFINTLLEKSFIILIMYLITRFANIDASLKTCVRMVMFASGVFVLLQFIVILITPSFSAILWIIQTWANILMALGILRASKGYKLFF